MPLEKQNISFNFGGGLNEFVDSDLVEPPTLLQVTNGSYQEAGRVDKRKGYLCTTKSCDDGAFNRIVALHNNNGQLISTMPNRLGAFDEGQNMWNAAGGYFRACELSKRELIGVRGSIIRARSAQSGSTILGSPIKVIIFETQDRVVGYKVLDVASGTTIYMEDDINNQLWGGRYASEADGGALYASQYSDVHIIQVLGKFYLFAVKDRYHLHTRLGAVSGTPEFDKVIIPPVGVPGLGGRRDDIWNPAAGDTDGWTFQGSTEAPKLVMWGLNLTNYQLTYQFDSAIPNERHQIYFDVEKYNNWNLEAEYGRGRPPNWVDEAAWSPVPGTGALAWPPSVSGTGGSGAPFPIPNTNGPPPMTLAEPYEKLRLRDQRYLSYDVCAMRMPGEGEPSPTVDYFTVLVGAYESVKLYLVSTLSDDIISTTTVAQNSPGGTWPVGQNYGYVLYYRSTPFNPSEGGFSGYGSASLFPFTKVALGQSGGGKIRAWCWRYNLTGPVIDPPFGPPNPEPEPETLCYTQSYQIMGSGSGGYFQTLGQMAPDPALLNGVLPEAFPEFDNPLQPWSGYNPLASADSAVGLNLISSGFIDPTVRSMDNELQPTRVLTMEVSPDWSAILGTGTAKVSDLAIPSSSTAISESFLFLNDPNYASSGEPKYLQAVALRARPSRLRTNFIFSEGTITPEIDGVLCKYSQAAAPPEPWGQRMIPVLTTLPYTTGVPSFYYLPYNNKFEGWVPPFGMYNPFAGSSPPGGAWQPQNLQPLSANYLATSPRNVIVPYSAPGSDVYDMSDILTIEALQAKVEDGKIFGDGTVSEITLNLTKNTQPSFINFANDLYINTGYLNLYDNTITVENNFHLGPVFGDGDYGGSSVDVWHYTAIYEWVDDNGNLHRSTPSSYISRIGLGGSPISVMQPIFTSKKITQVTIAVYRTTQGGSIFYRVSKLQPNTMPTSPAIPNSLSDENIYLRCIKKGDFIEFHDNMPDEDIIGNEILYTTGGILPNVPPPSFNLMTEFGGRIFGAGLDNPDRIYYSKIQDQNTSVEFSDALYIDIPPEGGDITGLSSLDANLIIFKENSVYRIYGSGPNDTGGGGSYSEPLRISSSYGASEHKSIVSTLEGVIFRNSSGGIYLLDRSLNFSFIGAPVQDGSDLDILHATNVPAKSEIRFISSNGEALVYEYEFKKWSRFTNHASTDACVWKDKFTMAHLDTQPIDAVPPSLSTDLPTTVWTQSDGYLDAGSPISLKVDTPWFKLAGIKGFQRCTWLSLLGQQDDPHDVNVKLYRDYGAAPTENINVDGADFSISHSYAAAECGDYADPECGFYGWPGDTIYQWRHKPMVQKCESIKLSFEDLPALSGVYDPSIATNFTLKNLTLYIGVKKGQFKLPERKTV